MHQRVNSLIHSKFVFIIFVIKRLKSLKKINFSYNPFDEHKNFLNFNFQQETWLHLVKLFLIPNDDLNNSQRDFSSVSNLHMVFLFGNSIIRNNFS